jgi:tetratricopeptide (TPR) repeat protein
MNDSFDPEHDINQLINMVMKMWEQGQFQAGETILLEALELALQLGDLSSIIYIRSTLASNQAIQWKYLEALDHCTWLISLASDPDYQDLLSWNDKREIKNGYLTFITCAQNLPNIADEHILSVLNEGIRWLERIGKDEWTSMLQFEKGNIHLKRGETSKAEDAYTKAQALFSRADNQEGVLLCQSQLVQVQWQATGNYNVLSSFKEVLEGMATIASGDDTPISMLSNDLSLATYYFLDGQINSAYELAQRAITRAVQMQTPAFLYPTYQLLSYILQADQQYQRAIDNVTQLLQSVPEYTPALIERSRLYNLADDQQSALTDVSLAITLDDQEASYFSTRSDVYREMRRYQEALQDINQALTLEPRNASYFYQRSDIYRYIWQYAQAIENINLAMQLEPQNALYYTQRCSIYREMRCYQEALEDAQRALELTSMFNAFIIHALVYRDSERYHEALQVLDHAIEIDPNTQFYYLHRGIIYRLQGDYRRARTDLAHNASGYSQSNVAWGKYKFLTYVQRSITYHYEEKYQLALQEATQAIELKPSEASCFSQRGAIYHDMGQKQSALADFQQAIVLDAYAPDILLQRAVIYRRLGQYQEALQDIDRAIELDPQFHRCYYTRASIYWMLKQYDRANNNIEQALKLAQLDVRPLTSSIGLIIYSLFAQHIADASEHFELFMYECQSAYFAQQALFMLRDFIHLDIALPTTRTFCVRLKKRVDELLLQNISD